MGPDIYGSGNAADWREVVESSVSRGMKPAKPSDTGKPGNLGWASRRK
jgi:hypothetical protein